MARSARSAPLLAGLSLLLLAPGMAACVMTKTSTVPEQWEALPIEDADVCPDVGGVYRIDGRESAAWIWFWFLPIWRSSPDDSGLRLDRDLALVDRPIESAEAILLDQESDDRVRMTILRDDRHPLAGLPDVTYAKRSARLQDSAREFECEDGMIEFRYHVDLGEAGDQNTTVRMARSVDGAVVVRVSESSVLVNPLTIVPSFVFWGGLHHYDRMPDIEIRPLPNEASHALEP